MTAKFTTPIDGISPSSASVTLGATQQFTSSVGTVWVAAYGTVSSSGLYTAPDAMPPSYTDTVLVAGAGEAACAEIQLLPASPPLTVEWNGRTIAFGNSYGDGPGSGSAERSGQLADCGDSGGIDQPNMHLNESRMHSPSLITAEETYE